jgi:hypothetical protein
MRNWRSSRTPLMKFFGDRISSEAKFDISWQLVAKYRRD